MTIAADLSNFAFSAAGVNTGGFTMRNKIINGAMQISQRQGVSVGATITSAGAGVYGPDRFWTLASITSVATVFQVSTGASDFPYAMRVQRGNGQTSTPILYAGQTIESFNCTDLSSQTITFSFYATAGANYSGGTAFAEIWTGTGTDQGTSSLNNATWTNQTRIMLGSFTPTTTRTRYSFTVAVGAGINEMAIRWFWTTSGTAGAADYIDFTGVQLEKGSSATSFEYRNYQQELAMCQRYFERWNSSSAALYQAFLTVSVAGNQIRAVGLYNFKASKRTSPTVTSSGHTTFGLASGGLTLTGLTFYPYVDYSHVEFSCNAATAGFSGTIEAGGTANAFVNFSAEL